ncbi:MAG TPA: DUF3943 domain-containing protein [Candidatus Krumholzibacteria bacterium]|nr:DUF3943 domain-containing protein [Candidatus Krumholzibacteria bacterium]
MNTNLPWFNRFRGILLTALFVLACAAASPPRVSAQESNSSNSPGVSEKARWGFFFNLGIGDQTGDFADQLHKGTTGEFGLLRTKNDDWRYGLSLSFGSWGLVAPYDHEPEFGFQRIDVLAQKMFNQGGAFRPYLEGRFGVVRLHPRSDPETQESLFNVIDPKNPPPDYKIGDSTTRASNGVHIGVMPGLEWDLNHSMALDLSLLLDYYVVQKTDLTPVGGPSDASSGFDWQARIGLLWWTDSGPDGPPPVYDAWGVRKSYGWAMGEAMAINFGASAFNEYVRNANFNQVSPRSWWANLQEGLTYDDNQFKTNQLIHPFNGACYFNAARANGVSFWPSYAIGIFGALQWEVAGETHPIAFNDIISTGIGGAAVGETLYRFSSMILDNSATGSGRFFREAGGFLTDPVRGFNRIVSGRAWKVSPNPDDDMDRRPPNSIHDTAIGWRRTGNGEYPSIAHDYSDYTWLRYTHQHGDVFTNSRHKPWDYFDGSVEFAAREKNPLIRLNVAGNWWTTTVGGEGHGPHHMAAFTQHFEYENTNAYEYGGQSIGPTFFSQWGTWHDVSLYTRMDILATILGAVNSDYSDSLAVVANQERFREYDYGPGAGARFDLNLRYHGDPILTAGYRLHFIYVKNGSIYEGGEAGPGLNARHWLHGINVRLDSPTIHNGWGIGTEYKSFTRESHYKLYSQKYQNISLTQLIKGTTPEFLVYVHWMPGKKSRTAQE